MLTKIFNALGALSLATVLAGGAFVGYLFGTGRLTAARVELVGGVLRGQLDQAPQPATAPAEVLETATTAPATLRASTQEELQALRERKHIEQLEAERAVSDLQAQRRLLEQVLQKVVQEQERLAADRLALAAQQEQGGTVDRDAGFRLEVELVSGLAAKQAKEHLLRVWQRQPADAVRLLTALSPPVARKVLEQFKSDEELQIRTDLLERIRLQSGELSARASGTTGGAAP